MDSSPRRDDSAANHSAVDDRIILQPPRWRPWIAIPMIVGAVLAAAGGGWLYATRLAAAEAGRRPEALAAVTMVGFGFLLVAVGLGCYVLGPGLRGRGEAWRGVGSHRLVLASTLLVVVLSNLGPIAMSLVRPSDGLCSVSGFLGAALSVAVALCGVTYVRFIRPGIITARDLGLGWGRLGRDVGTGLLLGVLVLFVSATIQATMERLGVRQTQLLDFQCIRAFPLPGFFAVVLGGAVLAPIAEELFFRGYVFGTYLRTRGPLVAYGLSSILFASLHLNLPAMLPILALGLIFAASYHRTGSIVPSMVGHALNNSVAFLLLYFVGIQR